MDHLTKLEEILDHANNDIENGLYTKQPINWMNQLSTIKNVVLSL